MSIKTPLKIDYQIIALKSLRKGIEQYDRRHGWRGEIANKIKNKNWKQKLKKFKLDPTLNWHFAEIIEVSNSQIKFITLDENKKGINGFISYENIKWTLSKNKTISDKHEVGDIVFVSKEKDIWKLKQYPKVNGGIVAIDPHTGDVKALVGGFNFKSMNLIELLKLRDSLDQLLNQ